MELSSGEIQQTAKKAFNFIRMMDAKKKVFNIQKKTPN
jgi:hypothetical protein